MRRVCRRLDATMIRFVPAELKAKWIQSLNRGTRVCAEFACGRPSAYFANSAVVPGQLWFWLRQVRDSKARMGSRTLMNMRRMRENHAPRRARTAGQSGPKPPQSQVRIRTIDIIGGKPARLLRRVSCFATVERGFYGTRVCPGWYQGSSRAEPGSEGREPMILLLQILILRRWPGG